MQHSGRFILLSCWLLCNSLLTNVVFQFFKYVTLELQETLTRYMYSWYSIHCTIKVEALHKRFYALKKLCYKLFHCYGYLGDWHKNYPSITQTECRNSMSETLYYMSMEEPEGLKKYSRSVAPSHLLVTWDCDLSYIDFLLLFFLPRPSPIFIPNNIGFWSSMF